MGFENLRLTPIRNGGRFYPSDIEIHLFWGLRKISTPNLGFGRARVFSRLLSLIRSKLRSCGPIGPFPVVESFPVADRLKKVRRFFRWNIKNEVLVENRPQPISGEEIDTCGIEPLRANFFPLNFPPRIEPLFFTDFFRDLNFERGFLCFSAFSFGFKT